MSARVGHGEAGGHAGSPKPSNPDASPLDGQWLIATAERNAGRYSRSTEDAQDVAAAAVTRFITMHRRGLPIANPEALLRALVRHAAQDMARSLGRRGPWAQGALDVDDPAVAEHVRDPQAADPLALLVDRERAHDVEAAVRKLPEALREAVELVYTGNLSIVEAAALLGIRKRTLEKRLERARDRLRHTLD